MYAARLVYDTQLADHSLPEPGFSITAWQGVRLAVKLDLGTEKV